MVKKYWAKIKKFGVWKTLLILLAVPNIIYWSAVRPVQVRLEYRQFQQAEQEIEALSQQIIDKIGQPDSVVKKNSCSRSEQKYTRGPRVCSVSISLKFVDILALEADSHVLRASEFSENDLRRGSAGIANNLKFNDNESYPQSIFQDADDIHGLNCALAYTFTTEQDTSGLLEVSISCSRKSLAEYFPATD